MGDGGLKGKHTCEHGQLYGTGCELCLIAFKEISWSQDDRSFLLRVITTQVKLCSCGSDTTFDILLLLLERADDPAKIGFYTPFDDASRRWAEFGAHVLDSIGLFEHGTGIGWPWLTPEGKIVLRFLTEFDTDTAFWPDWAYEGTE